MPRSQHLAGVRRRREMAADFYDLMVSLPVIYHSFSGGEKAVEEKMLWSGAAMGLSAGRAHDPDCASGSACRKS